MQNWVFPEHQVLEPCREAAGGWGCRKGGSLCLYQLHHMHSFCLFILPVHLIKGNTNFFNFCLHGCICAHQFPKKKKKREKVLWLMSQLGGTWQYKWRSHAAHWRIPAIIL